MAGCGSKALGGAVKQAKRVAHACHTPPRRPPHLKPASPADTLRVGLTGLRPGGGSPAQPVPALPLPLPLPAAAVAGGGAGAGRCSPLPEQSTP